MMQDRNHKWEREFGSYGVFDSRAREILSRLRFLHQEMGSGCTYLGTRDVKLLWDDFRNITDAGFDISIDPETSTSIRMKAAFGPNLDKAYKLYNFLVVATQVPGHQVPTMTVTLYRVVVHRLLEEIVGSGWTP